jgi:hypothetical protein
VPAVIADELVGPVAEQHRSEVVGEDVGLRVDDQMGGAGGGAVRADRLNMAASPASVRTRYDWWACLTLQ